MPEPEQEILDHQVEECPTCKGPLEQGYGLAGGGIGSYGYCERCDRIVWKCQDPELE
jgi:hypothetical protein